MTISGIITSSDELDAGFHPTNFTFMSRKLFLAKLKQGLPGVTPVLGGMFFEACLVCLETQGHTSGAMLKVIGDVDEACEIVWDDEVTDQMRRSWQDTQEVTEFAACGIAFLLVLELTNYTVIERSRRGTGFDYWLANRQDIDLLPFQYAARLEVSGILKAESEHIIRSRVKKKQEQTRTSQSNLPAYIVVVEFSRPLADMGKV